MRISVLGSGRWGSFLAWYSRRIGHEVMLWGRGRSKRFLVLTETRKNDYLTLQPDIQLTASLDEAVSHGEIVIVAISAQQLRTLAKDIATTDYRDKVFSLNMKGLENESGKRLSEVMAEELGNPANVAVWVGPGHVQDLAAGIPNCMVTSSSDPATAELMIEAFSSKLIRFYLNSDLIGTEVGAALKNVFGIAAGMLDGLGLSSLKGPLMARGPYETARLIQHLGGDGRSAYGLAHLGDYEATLFSRHSNNRMFGESFVTKREFGSLAEGVATLDAIGNMDTAGLDLPIISALVDVIKHRKDPRVILDLLFERPQRDEF